MRHSYVTLCAAHSSSKPLYLCPIAPDAPLRYGNPCSYSRWHHHCCEIICFYSRPRSQRRDHSMCNSLRKSVHFMSFSSSRESMSLCPMTLSFATRIHVFMPESTHIATGVLAFIPDSTKPFHWETSYLYLIASPWPGWGARWYCHRNPLFIPDRTFRESVNFQVQKSEKTA